MSDSRHVPARGAAVPLRLILGIGFLYHGSPKLFTTSGHESFTGMLQGIGVPAAEAAGWLVGGVEFLGGLALVLGILVRPASLLLAVNMLVAMFTVHLPNGFNFINIQEMTDSGPVFGMPGYEVNLLYLAGLVALLITGAGPLSVRQLVDRREGEPAADRSSRTGAVPTGGSTPPLTESRRDG